MKDIVFKPSRIQFKINVNFNLRDTKNRSVQTPVRLIVRFNNERIVFPSPFKIEPKNWNEIKQEARSNQTSPDGDRINNLIKDIKNIVEATFKMYIKKSGKYPPNDHFKILVLKELSTDRNIESSKKTNDLLKFIEQLIPDMEAGTKQTQNGKPFAENSIKIFRTLKANLAGFKLKFKYDLNFNNINLDFFEAFKVYMIQDLKYTTNTLAKNIRILKTINAAAYERELTSNQFTGNKFNAKTETVDTIYLNELELLTLCNLDLSKNQKLDRVRDLFILGCWTGLRFSDYHNIDPRDIETNRFKIKTQKTKQTVVIPILKFVDDILIKYKGITKNNLPPSISNQKMNQHLKELGKIANFNDTIKKEYTKGGKTVTENIPKHSLITTHTARRSFATNMYILGVPTLSIMAITGHKTEDAFLKYIRVSVGEHAEIVRKAFQTNKLDNKDKTEKKELVIQ